MDLTLFRQYLKENSKSENTINSYSIDINRYSLWFRETFDKELEVLYEENILDYKNYLKNIRQLNAATVNKILFSLKKYNEFLVSQNLQDRVVISKNTFFKIQSEYLAPAKLSESDVKKFQQAILESKNIRNYALIILLINTGIRISECLGIKLNDIDIYQKEIVILGKGNKIRKIYLNDKTIEAIKKYITERRKYINADKSEYLFLSQKGSRLDRTTVNKIFKKYSKKAHLSIYPHLLRHYFIYFLLSKGFNINQVAFLAGHKSINVSLRYANPSENEIKEKLNKI